MTVHPNVLRRLVAERVLGWTDVVVPCSTCPGKMMGRPPGAKNANHVVPLADGRVLTACIEAAMREVGNQRLVLEYGRGGHHFWAYFSGYGLAGAATGTDADPVTAAIVACLRALGVPEEAFAFVPPLE